MSPRLPPLSSLLTLPERWVLAAIAVIFLIGLVARSLHLRSLDAAASTAQVETHPPSGDDPTVFSRDSLDSRR